jgi:asparagine N-glycosylation enzyme membrane subunit Stt3
MKEEEIIEERKKKIKKWLFEKNWIVLVFILVLLVLAWHIRTANVPLLKDVTTGDYTLGPDLDPYLFLRYAKAIVENGSLPERDYMRYVPLGYKPTDETWLLPYMMAYFHKFLSAFSEVSINYSAMIFPAFMFLLTIIVFFFLAGKIFGEHRYRWYIASLASIILIIVPVFLPRTVAGIPEKESVAFLFMFLAFYFLLCSFKEIKEKKSYIFALLAGVSTTLMGLIWGGVIYVFTTIGIFGIFMWIFNKIEKKELISYGIWLFSSFILLPLIYERFSFIGLVASLSSGISLAVFLLIGIDYLLFKTKIKNIEFIKKIEGKYPKKLISVCVFVVFVAVSSSIVFGISFIPNFMQDITQHLIQPIEDRFSFTVAENRQPYFNEWENDFGPSLKGIPVLFWLFFVGSILLFYKTIKLKKKEQIFVTIAYSYFLFALIFSRYSGNSVMNGVNFISKLFYFSGVAVFGLCLVYLNYIHEKRKEESILKETNLSYLFLFALFFVAIVGSRSAIRLVMVLAPPASIIVAFIPFELLVKVREKKENKNIWLGLLVVVSILSLFMIFKLYQTTYYTAKSYAPGMYNQQWQKAMAWVRNNTAEDAVFSHWWDYGYWLQSIGNRPTMLDGGNAIVYWNHLFGRHVLTGHSEQEALEVLYSHNVSYLLIDPTDIGKYPAYASIGSDENYDKYSWLTTFVMNDKATKELRNETEYYYEGGFLLDEDFVNKKNETETLYPARRSYIPIVKVVMKDSNINKITNAEVMFYYQGKREWIPLNCVFFEGKKYELNKSGYDGCLYLIPAISSDGTSLNKKGAGIFVSSRVKKTNFARLYLFNESENFELVHSEYDYVMQALKGQGINNTEFVVYGDIHGPIKIWKINYPAGMKVNPAYLEIKYPSEELRLAKPGYYS